MFDVTPYTTGRPYDCGPACLVMMLQYYGQPADFDELRKACDTRMSGCSMTTLRKVGAANGLPDLKAWSMDAEEIMRQDRPAILWWKYNHYVVFCGLNDAGDVVICNPSRGRYAIDPGSFAALITGINPLQGVALFNGDPEDMPETATGAEEVLK